MIELKERHQVYAWKNTPVDKAVVNELVTNALTRMPSKQNLRRCNVTLIDMSIGNRDEIIYRTTMHPITETDYGFNPQVLSPWILCLGPREAAWEKNVISHDGFLREAAVELGLIAGYVTLLAPDMGLGTSFCGCITDRYGLNKILGYSPELFMGIGIEDTQATDFYCPQRKTRDTLPNYPETQLSLDTFYKVI
tara:strand:+ start:522 stop:1103 length:582 start_codon:yes stop_codon:yes gene_type:complete